MPACFGVQASNPLRGVNKLQLTPCGRPSTVPSGPGSFGCSHQRGSAAVGCATAEGAASCVEGCAVAVVAVAVAGALRRAMRTDPQGPVEVRIQARNHASHHPHQGFLGPTPAAVLGLPPEGRGCSAPNLPSRSPTGSGAVGRAQGGSRCNRVLPG